MKTRINKSLTWLIIICMLVTLFPTTAFASYSDVEQHWGQVSIEKWSDMGIIQGSNGTFRPNDSITRGEMAVIIDRIMNYQTKSSKNFSDLGQVFYTDAILKANAAGVIQGDGNTVRPTDKITREEAVVMIGRALGLRGSTTVSKKFSDSSEISSWATGHVNVMTNSGYINGSNGRFYPKSNITRAEAITILDNSIKKLFNEAKEYSGDISGMTIINTPGVVLKDMKIKGDLIISEGVGSGDVTLDSVTVSGKTIIRGGGANSIHIIGNSKISSIIMQKTDEGVVRIVTSDGSIVDAVVIDDGNDDVILNGSFDNVTIAADVTVKAVNAVIKNIVITSVTATLNVDKDSKITEINVAETALKGKIIINNQGTITKATVIEGVTLRGNKPVTLIAPTTTTGGSHSSGGSNSVTAKDFNSYTTTLVIDYSQATQLPLTGYFSKVVGTDRSVKVYIPENAPIRAKFTVIAIPDGVNTYSFLKNEGWINRADENGECIFALEPGNNGWRSQTDENEYIINAMKFLTSGTNDNKVSVFSNYGAFYLVGYNTGCAHLESWAANNPIFVNSQVYVNGTSVGQEYLNTVGAKKYNGKNTGGYDPGQDDDDFIQTLKDLGYDGTFMSQSEVPVPTWFIGYGNDSYSITYWKKANDVVSIPDGDVYHQDINSDAWQTQYANESILKNNPNAKYGMSQVKVSESANLSAEDIFKFHTNYIRYTTTFAYSNHLEYRLDYGKMLVDLQKKASSATVTSKVYNKPDGETGSYDFYAQADTKVKAYDDKTGTVISGIAALSDYNNDGKKDPRDYIAYVPDSAKEIWGDKGAPVVLVHPGMTQTASVFMDASMWWQVANDEGCVFIIVGEAYSSATGVSYKSDSAEFAYMLENIISSKISDYAKLDLTRIYGSGHSLGCRTIQDLSMSNPDLIAAVSSTSFPPSTTERTGEMMPNYFIHGQSDLPFELPDLWGNTGLQDWANYFFEANGLKTDINSYDSSNTSGRFHTYVWNNSQDIPMVKYGYTVAREHNCMPQEFTMGWDFLEHYSFEKDATGHVTARYYSPSGFINDDAVVIMRDELNLKEVTKAEFVAKISDYFAWPHPTEYNDIWKAPLKQFNDVKTSDTYGKQIEVAYEENIISPDAFGNFNPENKISRQDAAVIFAKAFKIADSNKMVEFEDSASISAETIKSVNALVELGFMSGKTDTLFAPNDYITDVEVNSIFNKITTTTVAPVQALPKQTVEPYTAPRRYIKLYTPTDGAKIYYTKASSTEGWPTVEDPTTSSDEYVLAVNGHISELVGLRSGELIAPDNYVVYKAIAVKDGKLSPVQTFKWHLNRSMDGDFLYEKLKEKTTTSPAVYEIYRNNESVRAMAWYVEGADSGIIFDALQTPENVKNLKTFIDENIATKPYISVLGHEHGDHDAQIPNFINGGIDVYANKRGWAAIGSPGGFGAVVTTQEAQSKVKNVEEGMTFDLGGGTVFEVYALPGHANGNVALYDRQSGYLFSSDFYGCTRAGSADTVGISGVRADLLLSFVQQVYSNYTKNGSEVTALFTGHDESELSDNNLKLFEAALQQVIDNGEAGCTPSVRGSNNRTTMIGDMYKDGTNWIALELGGKMGDDKEYLSSTTDLSTLPYMSDQENDGINYNAGGYTKYSVLSNIEIEGGELEGKTVQWAKSGNAFQWNGEVISVNPSLENRFNPWSYDYTINVPKSNESITIIPTTMSTKVKSIKLNGKEIGYRSSNNVPVSDGTVITISIIAPDNITTSTYSFTVKKGTLSAVNLDDVEAPTVDFTKANQLPITGYFEKNFDIGGLTRTAKVYIPEGTPVRAYFTVIAVPNNVDTEEFLVESGWKTLADERAEGLFVLEASLEGWGDFEEEQSYITTAINFLGGNNRFSVFGEHYFVGYGSGASALEAWATANPLKVISQVYVNSEALTEDYLNQFATMEFGGTNGSYGVIEFPDGFEKIKYNEVVLPTWYINPDSADSTSLNYWKNANDCADSSTDDSTFGTIYKQDEESDRWMTSFSGPISEVAVLNDAEFDIMNSDDTNNIYDFLSYYTRYENAVAYGNQLSVRANYDELGIEIKTMTVEGELREYMVYVPESAQEKWGDAAPAVVVLPGNSQTDKVFLDATQWWQVAQDEGFVLAIVCEQNNVSAPTTVSHKNTNEFYKQLKEVIVNEYNADPTRIYVTGQSAGSMGSQSLAIAMPEYFAAIASTSGASSPSDTGTISIDGISYNASNKKIPNYHIYGAGDLTFLIGDLWDATQNSLDSWATYHLGVNDFELGDSSDYTLSGWMNRFKTWTWSKEIEGIDVPFVKLTQNIYRSHNCISEEMPMLWDFLEHYSYEVDENNNVTRYYSPSGFVEDDKILIWKTETELVKNVDTATPIADGSSTSDTNIGKYVVLGTTGQSPNFATVITGTAILADIESANEVQGVAKWIGVLITTDKKVINLSVMTPEVTEFTALTQSDVNEAVAAGASGDNTFVWWLKAENITDQNDILIKVTGEDDSTAVTLSVSYNPIAE